MVQHQFWKNAVLTHVGPICGPKASHFQAILGFSMAQNASPQAQNGLKNNCFSIPNGPTPLLETHIFARFLTHFWSENIPFSKHFGIFHGPKRVTTCSKWAKKQLFEHPKWVQHHWWKNVFLTHFSPIFGPKTAHFQGIFHAPKRVTMG